MGVLWASKPGAHDRLTPREVKPMMSGRPGGSGTPVPRETKIEKRKTKIVTLSLSKRKTKIKQKNPKKTNLKQTNKHKHWSAFLFKQIERDFASLRHSIDVNLELFATGAELSSNNLGNQVRERREKERECLAMAASRMPFQHRCQIGYKACNICFCQTLWFAEWGPFKPLQVPRQDSNEKKNEKNRDARSQNENSGPVIVFWRNGKRVVIVCRNNNCLGRGVCVCKLKMSSWETNGPATSHERN